MCGLAGVYNPNQKKLDVKIIKRLLYHSDSRGGHATGLYSDVTGLFRDTMDASEFIINYNDELNLLKRASIILMHTRFATHGRNTIENAHPFSMGDVVLTHNGVLYDYDWVAQKYGFYHEVDSAHLLPILHDEQYQQLRNISGAMTLAFYKNQNLYFNKRNNPLFYLIHGGVLYYASEKETLINSIKNGKFKILTPLENQLLLVDKNFKMHLVEDTTPEYTGVGYKNWDDFYGQSPMPLYANNQ